MRTGFLAAAGAALFLCGAAAGAGAQVPTPAGVAPTKGKPAPGFALADGEGKNRTLSEFRGRPVALFFFCGCSWCADVGKEWAQMQRGGALATPSPSKGKTPITLVVNSGMDAVATRSLTAAYGLDPKQTVLLPEPDMTVTETLYQADPCPRVFIVDGGGIVRYTNDGPEDGPRKGPALIIVSRALDALRSAAAPAAPANSKTAPSKSRPKTQRKQTIR